MMILSEINVDVTSCTNLLALSFFMVAWHFTNTNNNYFGSLKTAAAIHHLWRVQKINSVDE